MDKNNNNIDKDKDKANGGEEKLDGIFKFYHYDHEVKKSIINYESNIVLDAKEFPKNWIEFNDEKGDYEWKGFISYPPKESENKTTKPDTSFTPSESKFKFLLPSKRREEIMGDLIETKSMMVKAGLPMWQIRAFLYWQMFLILVSIPKVKLNDFGTKKQTDKNVK